LRLQLHTLGHLLEQPIALLAQHMQPNVFKAIPWINLRPPASRVGGRRKVWKLVM